MRTIAVIIGADASGSLPPSDRAAMALGVRGLTGRVEAYSLRGDGTALRYALAAGAASASSVDDPAALSFDLALVGIGGCGSWGDLLPAMLAQQRGAAMVLEVLDASHSADGLRVVRDLGRGASEILRVKGPAVLAMSHDARQRLYVSRHRRRNVVALRSVPQVWTDPLTASAGPWEPARPRVKAGNIAAKTGGAATDRMNALVGATRADAGGSARETIIADAATCGEYLIRYLAHHGFLDKTTGRTAVTLARPRRPAESPVAIAVIAEARDRRLDPETARDQGSLLRGPRPLARSVAGVQRRPRPIVHAPPDHAIDRLDRGPRSLAGAAPGAARRPRPLPVRAGLPPVLGKWTRRPRPLVLTVSARSRGPYPYEKSTHG